MCPLAPAVLPPLDEGYNVPQLQRHLVLRARRERDDTPGTKLNEMLLPGFSFLAQKYRRCSSPVALPPALVVTRGPLARPGVYLVLGLSQGLPDGLNHNMTRVIMCPPSHLELGQPLRVCLWPRLLGLGPALLQVTEVYQRPLGHRQLLMISPRLSSLGLKIKHSYYTLSL